MALNRIYSVGPGLINQHGTAVREAVEPVRQWRWIPMLAASPLWFTRPLPSLRSLCAWPLYAQVCVITFTRESSLDRRSFAFVDLSIERVGHSDVKLDARLESTPDLKYYETSAKFISALFPAWSSRESLISSKIWCRPHDFVTWMTCTLKTIQTCVHWPTFSSLLTYAADSLNIEDVASDLGI